MSFSPISPLRCVVFAVLLGVMTFAARAAAPVWQDQATGLAIGGYDPVAYFTRGAPHRGDAKFEYAWRGAVWRFLNDGNRQAFARDPHVYMPRFAGYDAYAVTAGRTAEGSPSVWAIHGNRLFFFHNAANRRLWSQDPAGAIVRAERIWQRLVRTLPAGYGPAEPEIR